MANFVICMALSVGIFSIATKASHTKGNCEVNSNGVTTFYYHYIQSFHDCPPSLADCEGIGVNSTRHCKECCFPPTVPPTQMITQKQACQCEKQDDRQLPGLVIALIVVVVIESGFLIGIIGLLVYKFPCSMSFANKVPIQEESTSTDISYASVALNDNALQGGEKTDV